MILQKWMVIFYLYISFYVFKPFKKLLQEEAIRNDMSLVEWTKEVMSMDDPLRPIKTKKKVKYDFP